MTLHKIKDLVNRDVSRMEVDIRTRNSDGSLMYGKRVAGYHPVITKLKSVEIEHQKISRRDPHKSPWLYWYWQTAGIHHDYNCGYSGIATEFDNHYLMEV